MSLIDEEGERRALKFIGYFPVLLCLGIVGWSYYAFVITLCGPLLETNPTEAVIYLIIYHPLLILFSWSYAQVVLVHPGVPKQGARSREAALSPVPQTLADTHQVHTAGAGGELSASGTLSSGAAVLVNSPGTAAWPSEDEFDSGTSDVRLSLEMVELGVTVKRNGRQRFCSKCGMNKPDRTHHCRICRQCILKMDHHCPWINSCVGFRNQKHFVLFIVWGASYCLFLAAATVKRTLDFVNEKRMNFDMQWVFLILCGGLFGVSLLAFAGYHVHLILSNRTTIETFQRHSYRLDGGLGPAGHLNLFDLGTKRNWTQVMGVPWQLWFLPISNTPGDGMTWPLSVDHFSALGSGLDAEPC